MASSSLAGAMSALGAGEGARQSEFPFSNGFLNIPTVLSKNFSSYVLGEAPARESVGTLCVELAKAYKTYHWSADRDGCGTGTIKWSANLKSRGGSALIWTELGTGSSTTLILGGVHADELTPIPLVFHFANHLASHPELIGPDSRVVIAPLVNPDGFFRKIATRTNADGVDLNRNFFTRDWYSTAKAWWAERRKKDERHFPGHIPNSEIETLFQIWLIDEFKPDKIISIHAPLGFYDYDGPQDQKPRALAASERKAKTLVETMSESTKNYRIVDYSYYPGSLGNYAGIERGIPTVTLELETINPDKVDEYWRRFSPGLELAVKYPFKNPTAVKHKGGSLFLESLSQKDARALLEAPPKM